MRMQREEKIVFVLLLMALGSLAVAFWAFDSDDGGGGSPPSSNVQKISQETPLTAVEGVVVEIKPTKSGGHLLISIDSTQAPIFISRSAGAERLSGLLKKGDRITARGRQRDYQGQEEIEVSRFSDVQILK